MEVTTEWITDKNKSVYGTLITSKDNAEFRVSVPMGEIGNVFNGSCGINNYIVYTTGKRGCCYRVKKFFEFGKKTCFEISNKGIGGITRFCFEITGLEEWLDREAVGVDFGKDGIAVYSIKIPRISLMEREDVAVYIKYQLNCSSIFDDSKCKKTICNTPSIWVEFKEPQHDSKVFTTIKYIVRFWGLVMGRVTTLSNIMLYSNDKGICKTYFNNDFSYNSNINVLDVIPSIGIKKELIMENINKYFSKWYQLCMEPDYELLLEAYFAIHNKRTEIIEEVFLSYCRFIEGYSLRKNEDEAKAESIKQQVLPILNNEIVKPLFKEIFSNVDSSFKPKNVAEWISKGFISRISLSDRIRKIDTDNFEFLSQNRFRVYADITDEEELYEYISNTRNYYAHFKCERNKVLDIDGIYAIVPILRTTITSILLGEIGLSKEILKQIFLGDSRYRFYASHLENN